MKLSEQIMDLITYFPGIVGVYGKKIVAAADRAAALETELAHHRRELSVRDLALAKACDRMNHLLPADHRPEDFIAAAREEAEDVRPDTAE